MDDRDEIVENLLLELRRGTLVLSVLSQLSRPTYGYSLLQTLDDMNIRIEAGTLYPLLRRLEKQGLLSGEWEVGGSKPRKYYKLSAKGQKVYERLCVEWSKLVDGMNELLKSGE
jgi:DNA-binding PadR family transcriptional regulator